MSDLPIVSDSAPSSDFVVNSQPEAANSLRERTQGGHDPLRGQNHGDEDHQPDTVIQDDEQELPRVDPARGVFITSRGEEIELSGKAISALMLERIANEGKPKIPMKEVVLLGKHKQLEANPDDPGYKALYAEWEAEQRIQTIRYCFIVGVKGQAPPDFVEEQRPFFPSASEMDMKYLWVASRVPDSDIDAFIEAVIGQKIPTQKGMAEAADSFRR